MPRKLREDVEGAVHHVFARGVEKRRIFVDDDDRHAYLKLLAREVERHEWRCMSYCLMDNHVHLLIETPRANLADGMRRLHGAYAQRFNRRHGRTGHLFGERYGSVRVEDDAQMWMTVGYIARNPVAAGVAKEPAQWRWGSHAGVIAGNGAGGCVDVPRLLWYLGAFGGEPLRRYAECVTPTAEP